MVRNRRFHLPEDLGEIAGAAGGSGRTKGRFERRSAVQIESYRSIDPATLAVESLEHPPCSDERERIYWSHRTRSGRGRRWRPRAVYGPAWCRSEQLTQSANALSVGFERSINAIL